jgi:hypothetical protein
MKARDVVTGGLQVGGDRADPGRAAGGQIPEEREPAGAVFGAGDLQTEDLPVPIGVDAGGEQGVYVDHAAALADLEGGCRTTRRIRRGRRP